MAIAYPIAGGLSYTSASSATESVLRNLDLTSTLPAGLTYTRSDSVATVINNTGAMQTVASNTPRFNHNSAGVPLGLLFEPSRQNKCTAYNLNPTDLTGLTVAGNASASVTIVDDPVALAAAGINFGNGKVIEIDNTLGGSGAAWVTVAGTVGNTNAHVMSAYMYVVTGSNVNGYILDSNGGSALTGQDFINLGNAVNFTTGYNRIYQESYTPTSTTRSLRLAAALNSKVRYILFQLEEGNFVTTPIIVAGAAATRQQDRVHTTDMDATFGDAYNQSRGTIGIVINVPRIVSVNQIFAQFSNGTVDNVIGLQLRYSAGSEVGYVRPSVSAGGVVQPSVSVAKAQPNRDFPMVIGWGNGGYKTIAGSGRTVREAGVTLPTTAFTRFDLGCRFNGGSGFYGHIKKLVIANDMLSNGVLGGLLMPTGAKGIVTAGQSLVDNHRRSQTTLDNMGEVAFNTVLDSIWTGTAGNNWMVHGAVGGAAVLEKYNGGVGSYYDDVTEQFKDVYTVWKDSVDFFLGGGGVIEAILWDGGQQDASADAFDTLEKTQEEYDGHITVWDKMRSVVGDVPVIISPTTGRTDTEDTMYQNLRELQWDLADDVAYVYRGAESFDLPKVDAVHLTGAGYQTKAQREARKILDVLGETISGGVDGPSVTNVSRSGTSITVTLSHDAGTDFTPTTGIAGFRYFDGSGNPITISAAVRTNATTITLTLASGVAGTLYYGYACLFAEAGNYANLVDDNGTPSMPLRAYKAAVA